MGDDRPFQCTEPGCNMRFTNEDHLNVHKNKHAMSLAFSMSGSKACSLFNFVADQTPTPTKFLKNCDEMGIFHDLTKNPFDDAFKKATESLADGKSMDLHESSPFHSSAVDGMEENSDILHTPNPVVLHLPISDSEHQSSLTTMLSPDITASHREYSPLPDPCQTTSGSTLSNHISLIDTLTSDHGYSSFDRGKHQAHSVDLEEEVISDGVFDFTEVQNDNNAFDSMLQEESRSYAISTDVTQSPWQQNISVSESHASPRSISSHVQPMLFQLVPLTHSIDTPTIYIPSPTGSSPLTIFSHLPSPLIYPVASVVSPKSSHGATSPNLLGPLIVPKDGSSKSVSNLSSSGITSTTRERLKAALRQNFQQNVLNNNMRVMSAAVDLVTTGQQSIRNVNHESINHQSVSQQSMSHLAVGHESVNQQSENHESLSHQSMSQPVSHVIIKQENAADYATYSGATLPAACRRIIYETVEQSVADTSTPRKRRLSPSHDVNVDKSTQRVKFLERNRAAAARCRQKKKVWVTDLEYKADEYKSSNEKLVAEMKELREEVALLRAMLAAHSDCPVTLMQKQQQQQKANAIATTEVPSSQIVVIDDNRINNNNSNNLDNCDTGNNNSYNSDNGISNQNNNSCIISHGSNNSISNASTIPISNSNYVYISNNSSNHGVISSSSLSNTSSTDLSTIFQSALGSSGSLAGPTLLFITTEQLQKSANAAIGYDEVVAMAALSTMSNNGRSVEQVKYSSDNNT